MSWFEIAINLEEMAVVIFVLTAMIFEDLWGVVWIAYVKRRNLSYLSWKLLVKKIARNYLADRAFLFLVCWWR